MSNPIGLHGDLDGSGVVNPPDHRADQTQALSVPRVPTPSRDSPSVTALLQRRDYVGLAQMLAAADAVCERAGDDGTAHLHAVARRVCVLCQQCRDDAERHRRAGEDAVAAEYQFHRQIAAILDLLPPTELAVGESCPAPDATETGARRWVRPAKRTANDGTAWGSGPIPRAVSPVLAAYCLGTFRVYQRDQLISDWHGHRGQSVFMHLVSHRGKPIPRDVLMDTFWSDAPPEAARHSLHQAIYALRKILGRRDRLTEYIRFENECYSLDEAVVTWVDFEEFERYLREGRRLDAADQVPGALAAYGVAENLYRGDFLESEIYEAWTDCLRRHLRHEYVDMAHRMSELYYRQGAIGNAIATCERLLLSDEADEAAHGHLIRCYIHLDQPHLAVRQYRACEAALRLLDLTPSDPTTALCRHLLG